MAKKKNTNIGSSEVALLAPNQSALALYDELFDKSLTAGAAGDAGLAPFISTEDGVMKHGQLVIGKQLDAVILGVAVEHTLYPGRYQKGKPSPALCFFVGQSEKEAAPDARSPQPQASACAKCPKNAFGSGQGNAKACRQSRRLLLLPLGPNESAEDGQLYRLRVPPTSIKHIVAYASKLEALKRPLPSVVTRIQFQGHETNRFEVKFAPVRAINEREVLAALSRRSIEGKDALFAAPMLGSDKKAEPEKGGRRIVRR